MISDDVLKEIEELLDIDKPELLYFTERETRLLIESVKELKAENQKLNKVISKHHELLFEVAELLRSIYANDCLTFLDKEWIEGILTEMPMEEK